MYVNGVVNFHSSRIGAALISSTGARFPVAMQLKFPCTNTITEYDACIMGLKVALAISNKDVELLGILIINQSFIIQEMGGLKLKVKYMRYLAQLSESF